MLIRGSSLRLVRGNGAPGLCSARRICHDSQRISCLSNGTPEDFLAYGRNDGGQPVQSGHTPSPVGLHRVLEPAGVLPQAADRLDTRRELWPDEVRIRVQRLNLDAASYRQLERKHTRADGQVDGAAIRAEVADIVAERGKMQNPETGS